VADILRCTDRWGREVTLTEALWSNKILPKHPEMIGHDADVAAAITDPMFVMHDASHADRENFYRVCTFPPKHVLAYVKVVVGFQRRATGPVEGIVISAFAVGNPKPGEQQKWP
jgi:hypothetical protein